MGGNDNGNAQRRDTGALADSVTQRLLDERIVVLGREVDDEVANSVSGQLLLLAADDPSRDITLYINSPGGSITAGLAIYDAMQWVEPDVATVATGLAASIAQFLLTAGAPGKRFALPHAEILMHQPHGGLGGTEADVQIRAEQFARLKRQVAELTATHSGHTTEEIMRDSDRDRWFTAAEAADYGLIDRVLTSLSEVRRELR